MKTKTNNYKVIILLSLGTILLYMAESCFNIKRLRELLDRIVLLSFKEALSKGYTVSVMWIHSD